MSYPVTLHYAQLLESVDDELVRAIERFGPFHSAHEGYAVIKEELDELWDAIKANDIPHARAEALQVAAMAVRFLNDIK